MSRWITSRNGEIIPVAVFLTVLAGVWVIDRELSGRAASELRELAQENEARATLLASQISKAVDERIVAMTAGELRFTSLEDSISRQTFLAVLDTVTAKFSGLAAVSVISLNGQIGTGGGGVLGRPGAEPQINPRIGDAFRRAQRTRKPAATPIIELNAGARVFVFSPVIRGDSQLIGYLAGELNPQAIVRTALLAVQDSVQLQHYAVFGPDNVPITTTWSPPPNWNIVSRDIDVADTKWTVRSAYEPLSLSILHSQRIATWVIGIVVSVALGVRCCCSCAGRSAGSARKSRAGKRPRKRRARARRKRASVHARRASWRSAGGGATRVAAAVDVARIRTTSSSCSSAASPKSWKRTSHRSTRSRRKAKYWSAAAA